MKPSEGKRMDSAMLPLRFSRRPVAARGLRIRMDRGLVPDSGSPSHFSWARVSVGRNWVSEVPRKVGLGSRLWTVTARLPRLGSDRGRRSACLLWLGSRPSGRSSTAVDCLQCSATAAGRWGGVLVRRAPDAGGHMGPSDPS